MNYAQHFNPAKTPQSEQADPKQEKNSAGGYSFKLDPWKRLDRWLILGADGGTYYATELVRVPGRPATVAHALHNTCP